MKIAVWFSCGAASAAALKITVDKYGKNNVYAVNNPIVEEHYDNKRFAEDVANWVGVNIQYAINSKYPLASVVDVFNRRKGMASSRRTMYR